jgi:hypothetical protein
VNKCRGCERPAQLFLCQSCQSKARDVLKDLALGCRLHLGETPLDKRGPSFLRFLHDTRLGFTRMGDSARRSTENSRPALARLTKNEKDSFKGSPLELSNEIHQTLMFWAEAVSGQFETLGKDHSEHS